MTKKDATKAARALLKLLKGRGWKTRVWENDGWHYAAVNGGLSVMPGAKPNTWWSLLGTAPHIGNGCWSAGSTPDFKNPNRSVRHTTARARTQIAVCLSAI